MLRCLLCIHEFRSEDHHQVGHGLAVLQAGRELLLLRLELRLVREHVAQRQEQPVSAPAGQAFVLDEREQVWPRHRGVRRHRRRIQQPLQPRQLRGFAHCARLLLLPTQPEGAQDYMVFSTKCR
eukprot:Gregarina_sp_Pseudo_9__1638@NODE_2100_length_1150_cov_12_534653_g1938_i0_p2_GENE_NODE_2100_length_1150_cov_12_534653_g1938_i0NODE_2100_length_1150_cov_12_534653_g1938_i0_p2_ORF_typecomplete_len124_score13_40_NODE_2100_length_1150_cov_12_534653_g1938_i06531024